MRRVFSILLAFGVLALVVVSARAFRSGHHKMSPPAASSSPALAPVLATPLSPTRPMTPLQARIVAGGRAQIGDIYDASYVSLAYPDGDPPAGRGACTDVIVRSLRAGGCDLQPLVHRDMAAHWDQYPHRWGLRRPDASIDHRRVPNLACFFGRYGQTLTRAATPATLAQWQPGDIVCWRIAGGLDHIGLVSDRLGPSGLPLVIHNIGGCAEQDVLTQWPIVGHYRYPRQAASGLLTQ